MKGNKCIKISRIEEREFGFTGFRNPVDTHQSKVHIVTWWSSSKRYNLRLRSWAIFKK